MNFKENTKRQTLITEIKVVTTFPTSGVSAAPSIFYDKSHVNLTACCFSPVQECTRFVTVFLTYSPFSSTSRKIYAGLFFELFRWPFLSPENPDLATASPPLHRPFSYEKTSAWTFARWPHP
jgi:hypothetical protein